MVVAEVCSTMKYPKRSQYKHAKQKKYHVRNWAKYNEGLRCCMIPTTLKESASYVFGGKKRRINGISELPAFMQQRRGDTKGE